MSAMPSRTLTGAWIETLMYSVTSTGCDVAPSRVRGLKLVVALTAVAVKVVAPSRVRGLKLAGGWSSPLQPWSHPHGCVD